MFNLGQRASRPIVFQSLSPNGRYTQASYSPPMPQQFNRTAQIAVNQNRHRCPSPTIFLPSNPQLHIQPSIAPSAQMSPGIYTQEGIHSMRSVTNEYQIPIGWKQSQQESAMLKKTNTLLLQENQRLSKELEKLKALCFDAGLQISIQNPSKERNNIQHEVKLALNRSRSQDNYCQYRQRATTDRYRSPEPELKEKTLLVRCCQSCYRGLQQNEFRSCQFCKKENSQMNSSSDFQSNQQLLGSFGEPAFNFKKQPPRRIKLPKRDRCNCRQADCNQTTSLGESKCLYATESGWRKQLNIQEEISHLKTSNDRLRMK